MSPTHDYIISNQSGASFRTDLNNALAAIVSNNSNSSSPATTYAYQWWADTSAGILKLRNSANNAWIDMLNLDGTFVFDLEDGTNSAPSLRFADDTNTGIFSPANDKFAITTGGSTAITFDDSQRGILGHTGIVQVGTDNPRFQVNGASSSTAQMSVTCFSANTTAPVFSLSKSRGSSVGTFTAVADDDGLGEIRFNGADGSDLAEVAAAIKVFCDATVASNRVPSRFEIHTTDGNGNLDLNFVLTRDGNVYFTRGATRDTIDGLIHSSANDFAFGQTSGGADTGMTVISPSATSGFVNFADADGTRQGVIVYQHGSGTDQMAFRTNNNVNALNITKTQHVLVGTTSKRQNFYNGTSEHAPLLQVEGANNNQARGLCAIYNIANSPGAYLVLAKTRSNSLGGQTIVNSGDELGMISFQGADGTNFVDAGRVSCEVDGTPGADDMPGRIDIKTTPDGSTGPTTRMRFKANGDIQIQNYGTLFGNTGMHIFGSVSGGPVVQVSRNGGDCMLLNRNGSDGTIIEFRRGWGAGGSISVATNSATYNTSSDYRLKENIVAISDGITRLKTLKPSRFNWIGDTSSTRDGFIAHEVTAVPEAITGTKDEVYTEDEIDKNIKAGDPKYQGIDQAKLVPLITAALQEAVSKIEVLETKVAALEAA